jgi:hypothetical protein
MTALCSRHDELWLQRRRLRRRLPACNQYPEAVCRCAMPVYGNSQRVSHFSGQFATTYYSITRMKSLSNVLRDIEDILSEHELIDRQDKDLRDTLKECHSVLNDMGRVLSKYYDLDTSPKKFSDKSRRVWRRIKWEPDDIRYLRSRVTSNVALLNTFNGSLTRYLSVSLYYVLQTN